MSQQLRGLCVLFVIFMIQNIFLLTGIHIILNNIIVEEMQDYKQT